MDVQFFSKENFLVLQNIITSLTDSYNPSWNPTQFIGHIL